MSTSCAVRHTHAVSTTDDVPAARSATRRVLITDDDAKLCSIIARSLERAGYTCAVVASGDQALWAVNANEPDALVLDVMIPHPSGIEVARHLRNDGFSGPIVVISARSTPDDRAAAQRAGADAFLAKPFSLAQLVRTLDQLTAPREHDRRSPEPPTGAR